jgi:hypothetical protein
MEPWDSEEREVLLGRIAELESEHRDLDDVIERITGEGPFDQLQMQRLKKRKLSLRDQLQLHRSKLIPDNIA